MKSRTNLLDSRAARAAALALGAACLLGPAAMPPAQEGELVGDARALLQEWVETRRQISKERSDWALAKDLLESRIALIEGEIGAVRNRTAEIQADIAKTDKSRAEIEADKVRFAATSAELASALVGLEERTRALVRRLPVSVREKLAPISQSLPKDAASADPNKLSERYLTVVAILNEVNKFNREIRAESEIREFDNGSKIEVTTLYVGLGQAYYASGDGKTAGYGVPSDDGWTWIPADDQAAEVVGAIEILTKGADARFTNLPIRLQ
jgi:septal ring factor EnvC (AmiA/AmiB activator)